MENSREFLLGKIQGLIEAEAICSQVPTTYAYRIRQEIEDILKRLRSDLVDGHHA